MTNNRGGVHMVDKERLNALSKWGGFVGVMTIISGIISALIGVFAFVVGAIPGIITIILGVKLINARAQADALISANIEGEQNLNVLFDHLNGYFKIQGILIIVSLVLLVISIIVAFATGFNFFDSFMTTPL